MKFINSVALVASLAASTVNAQSSQANNVVTNLNDVKLEAQALHNSLELLPSSLDASALKSSLDRTVTSQHTWVDSIIDSAYINCRGLVRDLGRAADAAEDMSGPFIQVAASKPVQQRISRIAPKVHSIGALFRRGYKDGIPDTILKYCSGRSGFDQEVHTSNADRARGALDRVYQALRDGVDQGDDDE